MGSVNIMLKKRPVSIGTMLKFDGDGDGDGTCKRTSRPSPLLSLLLNVFFFYCHQNNGEKKGASPIRFIVHAITIGTMLNVKDGGNKHGLENATYK